MMDVETKDVAKSTDQIPTLAAEATEESSAAAQPPKEPEPSEEALVILAETMPDFPEDTSIDPKVYLKFILNIENRPLPESDLSLEQQERVFFEDLSLSMHAAPPIMIDMATATEEEKAKERKRRLNHPQTKFRFVFQQWPRDPNGPWIKQDDRRGKETSSGSCIWGATLLDFYFVLRSHECPNLLTISSGSRIAKWMKEHREVFAPQCLQAAEEEEDPRVVFPCDIGQLITDNEKFVSMYKQATWNPETKKSKKGKAKLRETWELPANWPPRSPFSPLAYPFPWPLEPFDTTNYIRYPKLQSYITPSRLPAKLIVHDPGRTLHASPHMHIKDTDGAPDIKYVYTLRKSTKNTEREQSDLAELKKMEATRKRHRDEFLEDAHSNRPLPSGMVLQMNHSIELGPCVPPIFIVFPHLPERPQIPEAHLYMSPRAVLGQGSHSYVYSSEFELPRSFLIDEQICSQCVLEDVRDIINEEDKHGRDPIWDEYSGRHVEKVTRKIGITAALNNKEHVARAPCVTREVVYEGPYRAIETRVKYQDLSLGPYCEHLKKNIHPLTSKVIVAAKLSINGDPHLAREAEVYQQFPRHFFEHWNGYNIVYPLKDPTPVGALVPQYYGYYVVDRAATEKLAKEKQKKQKKSKKNKNKAKKAKKAKPQAEDKMDVDTKGEGGAKEKGNKELQAEDKDKTAEEMEPEDETETEGEDEGEGDETETQASKIPHVDKGKGKQKEEETAQYLSPILLVEDCGQMIDPDTLSIDDKNECAALLYRLHEQNWLHNSVARRNIVRQPGPLSAWPLERLVNKSKRGGLGIEWSYRLIDFGRTTKVDENIETQLERNIIDGWMMNMTTLP